MVANETNAYIVFIVRVYEKKCIKLLQSLHQAFVREIDKTSNDWWMNHKDYFILMAVWNNAGLPYCLL